MTISDYNAETGTEVVAQEENSEVVNSVANNGENGKVAKPTQTKEENRQFAALRREAEKAKAELEKARANNNRLFAALNANGYVGTDAQTLADALEADKEGITPEQIRARREDREKEIRAAVENDPEYKRMKEQNKKLSESAYRWQVEKDVAEINSAYPNAGIKNGEDLGELYHILRANGVGNLAAFRAAHDNADTTTAEPVAELPSVNGATATPVSEFFTEEQLNKLTKKDLDDEEIYNKARRSMQRRK